MLSRGRARRASASSPEMGRSGGGGGRHLENIRLRQRPAAWLDAHHRGGEEIMEVTAERWYQAIASARCSWREVSRPWKYAPAARYQAMSNHDFKSRCA